MNPVSQKKPGRREFFASLGRSAALAVIAAGAALASLRRCKAIRRGGYINRGICGGCEYFADCTIGQGLFAKSVLPEDDNGKRRQRKRD